MRKLSPALSVFVLAVWAGVASAQTPPGTPIFDSIHTPPGFKQPILGVSTAGYNGTDLSTLKTAYTGEAFNFGNVNTSISGGLNLTGLDFFVGEVKPTDFADVQVHIQLYNLYTGSTPDLNPSSPVFANPIANPLGGSGPTWTQDLGAISTSQLTSLSNGSGEVLEHLSFLTPGTPTGLTVSGLSNLGIVISFSETTTAGGPLTTSGNVSAGIRLADTPPNDPGSATSTNNSPYAIGTDAARWQSRDNNYLYFRNKTGNGNFNFVGSDGNDFAPGDADLTAQFFSGLALIMYGQGAAVLPEPPTSALLFLGAALSLGASAIRYQLGRRRVSSTAA